MSKKKSRRQRRNATSNSKATKSSTKKLSAQSKITTVASQTDKKASDNIEYSNETKLVLGDIRKTIMLSFVIVVFYTIMYFVLQRSEIINSVTRLLRVGS